MGVLCQNRLIVVKLKQIKLRSYCCIEINRVTEKLRFLHRTNRRRLQKLQKSLFSCHLGIKACISFHVPAIRQGRHPRLWSGSSVRLERQPVTLEVAGSSPVRFATLFRKNSRLRAAFLHSDFLLFLHSVCCFKKAVRGEQRFSEALGQNLLFTIRFPAILLCSNSSKAYRILSGLRGKCPFSLTVGELLSCRAGGACLIWAQSSLMMSA